MRRFEYLAVMQVAALEAPDTSDDDSGARVWVHKCWVWPPYSTSPVEHVIDLNEATNKLVDLFNDLGAEGWELVVTSILDTTITASHVGVAEIATPVRQRWMFKRELEQPR